jgi:hypothetical protein
LLSQISLPDLEERAWQVFDKLCTNDDSLNGQAIAELSAMLVMVPFEKVYHREALKAFIYKACRNECQMNRSNAFLLIRHFAKLGDDKAVTLLREAPAEPDARAE